MEEKKIALKFLVEIDVFFLQNYLDYLYFEKKNSPSTYNNHLRFMNIFLLWCKGKGFISANPAEHIKTKAKTQKKREYYPLILKTK